MGGHPLPVPYDCSRSCMRQAAPMQRTAQCGKMRGRDLSGAYVHDNSTIITAQRFNSIPHHVPHR